MQVAAVTYVRSGGRGVRQSLSSAGDSRQPMPELDSRGMARSVAFVDRWMTTSLNLCGHRRSFGSGVFLNWVILDSVILNWVIVRPGRF